MFKSSSLRCEISVVIPTYNRPELLRATLESLAKCQVDLLTFEVIVVDDGSNPPSLPIVQAFETRLDIKYVYQRDDGFRAARARNLGASLAEGHLLLFLDSGVLAHPAMLEAHWQGHVGAPSRICIGYVYGFAQTNHNEVALRTAISSDDLANVIDGMSLEADLQDIRELCYKECADDLMKLAAPWALAWTCNISVSAETFGNVGGFDEAYRSWGAEDVDFALGHYRRGGEFKLLRAASSIHFPHEKSALDHTVTATANKSYMHSKYRQPIVERLINSTSISINLESAE